MARLRLILAAACAAALLSSCDQLFDEGAKTNIASAEKKAAAGDFRNAIKLYEAALDGTVKTADVHYKLAVIYDSKMKNPKSALHHFERYLEFAPKGIYAKEAETYRANADQKILRASKAGAVVSQREAARLRNENLALTQRLTALQARKDAPSAPATAATAARDKKAAKPLPPGAKTHVVQPGETLASIAQRYYKNRGRANDILDANFNALGGKTVIRPGQTLIIP